MAANVNSGQVASTRSRATIRGRRKAAAPRSRGIRQTGASRRVPTPASPPANMTESPPAPPTAYDDVAHRGARGTLTLSSRGVAFSPEDAGAGSEAAGVDLPWTVVAKHQVSPSSHPKSLLRVVTRPEAVGEGGPRGGKPASHTFQFAGRAALEAARREVSDRLGAARPGGGGGGGGGGRGRGRPRPDAGSAGSDRRDRQPTPPSGRDGDPPPPAPAARPRAPPALRAQHRLLVLQSGTLSESDFWETHGRLVANEYARISGRTDRGTSSDIRSSLDLGLSATSRNGKGGAAAGGGVVHLGVEEMRQIFLMYPAVHRAYEEKVPLELSEEQFWRKYLESEYFHRDRGRTGTHVGRVNEREAAEQERISGKRRAGDGAGPDESSGKDAKKKKKKDDENGPAMTEDEAKSRLAARGTDDIFSLYERGPASSSAAHAPSSRPPPGAGRPDAGTRLAAGQFDLTSTAESERGRRFLEMNDLHPSSDRDNGDGAGGGNPVVDKYNRHWAVVLGGAGPGTAADANHGASRSTANDDAEVGGGNDREMRRLVGFAGADEGDADCARESSGADGYTELRLDGVDAYSGKFADGGVGGGGGGAGDPETALKYSRYLAANLRSSSEPLLRDPSGPGHGGVGFASAPTLRNALPDPRTGRGLLEALTKKMAAGSRTEEDVERLAGTLSDEFRETLAAFFRRSSELLRHFFALRRASAGPGGGTEAQKRKLGNIVRGMEKVHGEMYSVQQNLDVMESKMLRPLMDQIDSAFQLHRGDGQRAKGGGGFVTVSKGGFVPVS